MMGRDGPPCWRSVPALRWILFYPTLLVVYLYCSNSHLIFLYKIFNRNEFLLIFHRGILRYDWFLEERANGKMMKGFLFAVDK